MVVGVSFTVSLSVLDFGITGLSPNLCRLQHRRAMGTTLPTLMSHVVRTPFWWSLKPKFEVRLTSYAPLKSESEPSAGPEHVSYETFIYGYWICH